MKVCFRSLCSGSSGNCLILRSPRTTILLDCGIPTQSRCDAILKRHAGNPPKIDAVLISHVHGDHVCYSSLRSLARCDTTIHSHEHVLREIDYRHAPARWPSPPRLREINGEPIQVNEFSIETIPLPHDPQCPNVGFIIRWEDSTRVRKAVVCTDFFDFSDVLDHFIDADFIFVEANHDPQLLRKYPNYASRFHLPNGKTAELLYESVRRSASAPHAVMLGHLSAQRNTEKLALDAVRDAFGWHNTDVPFALCTAPRYSPSDMIHID